MGCPLYMYFVINVQEQGSRYETISSITVGMISDFQWVRAQLYASQDFFWKMTEFWKLVKLYAAVYLIFLVAFLSLLQSFTVWLESFSSKVIEIDSFVLRYWIFRKANPIKYHVGSVRRDNFHNLD